MSGSHFPVTALADAFAGGGYIVSTKAGAGSVTRVNRRAHTPRNGNGRTGVAPEPVDDGQVDGSRRQLQDAAARDVRRPEQLKLGSGRRKPKTGFDVCRERAPLAGFHLNGRCTIPGYCIITVRGGWYPRYGGLLGSDLGVEKGMIIVIMIVIF